FGLAELRGDRGDPVLRAVLPIVLDAAQGRDRRAAPVELGRLVGREFDRRGRASVDIRGRAHLRDLSSTSGSPVGERSCGLGSAAGAGFGSRRTGCRWPRPSRANSTATARGQSTPPGRGGVNRVRVLPVGGRPGWAATARNSTQDAVGRGGQGSFSAGRARRVPFVAIRAATGAVARAVERWRGARLWSGTRVVRE